MFFEYIKFYLLMMLTVPAMILAQANQQAPNGGAPTTTPTDGTYNYWGSWGWFWIIALLGVLALSIWWVSRPRPTSGGTRPHGTGV